MLSCYLRTSLISDDFDFTCHPGLDHATMLQSNRVMTYFFFFFLNRYDFCSNNDEPLILDPDSNVGNRIESITQRTAIIEGKNKVLSAKMCIWDIYFKNTRSAPGSRLTRARSHSNAQTKIQREERRDLRQVFVHRYSETSRARFSSGPPLPKE